MAMPASAGLIAFGRWHPDLQEMLPAWPSVTETEELDRDVAKRLPAEPHRRQRLRDTRSSMTSFDPP